MKERIVLAYTGGLDTSVAIGWIAEERNADIIAVAADVGQGGEDMEVIRERALACGAAESVVLDLKDEFADDFCLPALQANALYMDRYPLVSALSRPVIAKHLVVGGAGVRRDHRRARLHRQGQRPGALRGGNRRPGARPGRDRAGARLRHDARQGDRVRRAPRAADRRQQEVPVLDRPERLGSRRETGFLEDIWNGPIEDVYGTPPTPSTAASRTRWSSRSSTASRWRSTASRSRCSRRSSS